jgi:hypothetical protein
VTTDEIDEGVSIIDQALTECGKKSPGVKP